MQHHFLTIHQSCISPISHVDLCLPNLFWVLQSGPLFNPDVGSINACTGDYEYTAYNYNIHKWTAILFVVLFALSSAAHLVQAILSRRWYLLGTIFICALTETLGVSPLAVGYSLDTS